MTCSRASSCKTQLFTLYAIKYKLHHINIDITIDGQSISQG